ncbi:MAG: hemolysin family protein [Alphaproteobacteria bacterium]
MSDPSHSTLPRDEAALPASPGASQPQFLRGLLQKFRRTRKADESLREVIEELIEDSEPLEGGERDPAAINPDERLLLQNILHLRDVTAYDVMVPRADISAVEISTPLPELIRMMTEEAHSRLPVYRESLDDVRGVVHIKDVLAQTQKPGDFDLEALLRKVLFVSPSMRVLDLLLEMRLTRVHMAMVVDEYGGIDGLVTIEDMIEAIVGDIQDEHDAEEPGMIERPDGSWLADARTDIEHFEEKAGQVLTEEEREADIDTLGGLVVFLAGRVPARGEIVRHSSGVQFEIVDGDPRRVKRLRLRLPARAEPAADAPRADAR